MSGIFLLGTLGTGWYPVKIGAGGFISSIVISADGSLRVISTDGNNAWKSVNGAPWVPLITTATFASTGTTYIDLSAPAIKSVGGSYAVAFAPSDLSRIYLAYGSATGAIFVSRDQGKTFNATPTQPSTASIYDPNNSWHKYSNNKLSVDPANADIVYVGVPPVDGSQIASITIAAPGIITTFDNHGFTANQKVIFTNGNLQAGGTTAFPTGITPGAEYFVMSTNLTGTTFSISTSSGNIGPVTTSGTFTASGTGPFVGLSTPSAFVSTDAGATWNPVPNIPNTGKVPVMGIFFDPSSAVVGGKTQGIYILSRDNGVYRSTNGGTSFTLVGGANAATQGFITAMGSSGAYYVIDPDLSKVRKLTGGTTWTDISPAAATSPSCVSVSPFDPNRVIVQKNAGDLYMATDGGTVGGTWTALAPVPSTRTAVGDVKWMDLANEGFMGGQVIFDPVVVDKLWFAEGLGVWYSLQSAGQPTTAWRAFSSGIEELIGQQLKFPPGGSLLATFSDRGIFRLSHPDTYPDVVYGPQPLGHQIGYGASVDWATDNPNYVVCMDNWNSSGSTFTGQQTSWSNDGGQTWTRFTASPISANTNPNGCLAVTSAATPANAKIIYVPSNKADVYYSVNNGNSWSRVDAAVWGNGVVNANGSNNPGWHQSYFLNRQTVCADRVLLDTLYILNASAAAQGGGLYKITFPGGVFTAVRQNSTTVFGSDPSMDNGGRMFAVPNLVGSVNPTGHLFICSDYGNSTSLRRSTDGGITWTIVANISSAQCFGFGAVKPGNDYPSVMFCGILSGVYGIYRSDSSSAAWAANTQTWTFLGAYPLNCGSQVISIEGDPYIWGKFYVLTVNGGGFYSIA